MSHEPAISLRDVRKTLSDRRHGNSVVLEGLSLDITRGTIVGLFGFSGCGKTTLLRIISGVIDVDSGHAKVFGAPATQQLGNVAYLPQRFGLLPWRTLWSNALLGWSIKKQERVTADSEIERRARTLFAKFDLADQVEKYPADCSVGQQQRAAVIRTLLTPSEILALDEPAAALDHISRQTLYATLENIRSGDNGQSHSRTVLIVSHDPEDLLMMCDKVVLLSRSRHKISRTFDVTFGRPRAKELRFDPSFSQQRRELWESLE